MPTGKTLAKPMSLMTWKAMPQPRPTLPPPADCHDAMARHNGASAEISVPMVSLVISSGSDQRFDHHRQKMTARAIVAVEMKASTDSSQVTGMVSPKKTRL